MKYMYYLTAIVILLTVFAGITIKVMNERKYIYLNSRYMKNVSKALLEYANSNDGKWPEKDGWCDALIEKTQYQALDFAGMQGKEGFKFRFNSDAFDLGIKMPEDMVLVYESDFDSWNKYGDKADLIPRKYPNNAGAIIMFGNGKVKFIKEKEFSNLKWQVDVEI